MRSELAINKSLFATSFIGVLKGRFGIAIGNILGSDLMNLLGVLGVSSIIMPYSVDPAARLSVLGVLVTIVVLVLCMRVGWCLTKRDGIILLSIGLFRWILDIAHSMKML